MNLCNTTQKLINIRTPLIMRPFFFQKDRCNHISSGRPGVATPSPQVAVATFTKIVKVQKSKKALLPAVDLVDGRIGLSGPPKNRKKRIRGLAKNRNQTVHPFMWTQAPQNTSRW